MSLYEDIVGASQQRSTKAEIVDYYKSHYPASGKGSWKQRLAHDLAEITGMKPKNLERRFDPSRINNVERRNTEQYQELGDMLPPMPPEGGYHIWGTVWVKFSDGNCEERDGVDEYITGEEATALLKMASDAMEQAVLNHYMKGEIENDAHVASFGDCQPPELHVEPIE